MRAGELNTRITLQEPIETVDSNQEMIISYSDIATVWAAVQWGSGRRYVEAAQLSAEVQGVIRIRYRPDIKPDWRIQYGDRYFSILSISNVRERNEELQLNCKEFQD